MNIIVNEKSNENGQLKSNINGLDNEKSYYENELKKRIVELLEIKRELQTLNLLTY